MKRVGSRIWGESLERRYHDGDDIETADLNTRLRAGTPTPDGRAYLCNITEDEYQMVRECVMGLWATHKEFAAGDRAHFAELSRSARGKRR